MPAARYWRISGFGDFGAGDLSISQVHLYKNGVRVGTALVPSSSHSPTSGALGDLSDDSDTTGCTWPRAQATSGGFYLQWDFAGSPSDVDEIRLKPMGAGINPGVMDVYYQDAAGQWVLSTSAGTGDFDPLRTSVVLLARFDGVDGATGVANEALVGVSIACIGGAKLTTTGPKFGTACLLLSAATSDGVKATNASSAFDFGANDFSIEVWCYTAAFGAVQPVVSTATAPNFNGFFLGLLTDGRVYACVGAGGSDEAVCISPSSITVNTWQKLEYSRSGNAFYLFVNGALVASTTSTTSIGASTSPLSIGCDVNNRFFSGKIDSVRITKGAVRHVAAHTVDATDYPGLASRQVHTAASAAQIAASTPVPAFSTRTAPALITACDVEVGGPGTIYGTTKTKGSPNAPTKARVVLAHQRSKLPVRETWSDPITGYFEFRGIDVNQQFLTLAEDVDGNFRPVAANRLTPEVLA